MMWNKIPQRIFWSKRLLQSKNIALKYCQPKTTVVILQKYLTSFNDHHSLNDGLRNIFSYNKLTSHSFNFFQVRFYSLPSYSKIVLPALSPTMETGTIVKWQVNEGDRFEPGDLLADIETDKATMGFEAIEEGYVAKILVQEGTKDVALGTLVAIAVENEDDIAAFKNVSSGKIIYD